VASGVIRTRVGYAGGSKQNPTYHNLGDHTETVELEYDPSVISYDSILQMFWKNHNPTTAHQRQYMSAIFYYGDDQKSAAKVSMDEAQKQFRTPIVTKILPIDTFYEAEDYHQKYLLKHQTPSLFHSLGLTTKEEMTSSVAAKLNGYVGGFGSAEQFEKEFGNWGLSEQQIDVVRQKIAAGCVSATCGL